ncbi:CoA transferase [Streptomyces sp. L7]
MTAATTPGHGPLSGVRVIELAGIGPGPFAAMLLADLGADVVRVVTGPAAPDLASVAPEHDITNRNKRSVLVDLKVKALGRPRTRPRPGRTRRHPHRGQPPRRHRTPRRRPRRPATPANPKLAYGRRADRLGARTAPSPSAPATTSPTSR